MPARRADARYSPHSNPAERIWGALKNYVTTTAVTCWAGPALPEDAEPCV